MSIATGTYPSIAYSPVDGCELVCYIRNANLYVRRKLGETASYGAEILVAAVAADSMATITPIADSRLGLWVIALKDAGGALHRYTSRNSGASWTIDS